MAWRSIGCALHCWMARNCNALSAFAIHPDGLRTEKYSFHWQRTDGSLICRWDDAPHHPELSTFPHHIHESADERVLPHNAMDIAGVLERIEQVLAGSSL